MKLFVLIVATLAACSAKVVDPNAGYKEGDRFIFFPDGDGVPRLVDLQDVIDHDYLNGVISRNANDNQYWLYTRDNPYVPQFLEKWNTQSVIASNFNAAWPVVVIVHGWNSNGHSDVNTLIRDAFLQTGDFNVIVVDWRDLANRNYITAKNGVGAIGRALGELLYFLEKYCGAPFSRMHLVGFSLGAHVAGVAGRDVRGQIARVSALDPAGPLFSGDSIRVQPTDAINVEGMHTSSVLGINSPVGHVDFFPNGGSSMPGCWISTCSHSMAYQYFTATIRHRHLLGNRCENQRDAERDRCTGPLYEMGNGDYNKTGSGIYRVNTGRNYPF